MKTNKTYDTVETYKIGFNAGLDSLDSIRQQLGGKVEPDVLKDALAGLLTACMRCTYAFAPTQEAAEELIELSQKFGLEDFKKEKEKITGENK
tara:strand:- start:142 stop:420 length:279 start_codon:yes stop_codon:yes gene_type:complete